MRRPLTSRPQPYRAYAPALMFKHSLNLGCRAVKIKSPCAVSSSQGRSRVACATASASSNMYGCGTKHKDFALHHDRF